MYRSLSALSGTPGLVVVLSFIKLPEWCSSSAARPKTRAYTSAIPQSLSDMREPHRSHPIPAGSWKRLNKRTIDDFRLHAFDLLTAAGNERAGSPGKAIAPGCALAVDKNRGPLVVYRLSSRAKRGILRCG